jgi:hypothetical protein
MPFSSVSVSCRQVNYTYCIRDQARTNARSCPSRRHDGPHLSNAASIATLLDLRKETGCVHTAAQSITIGMEVPGRALVSLEGAVDAEHARQESSVRTCVSLSRLQREWPLMMHPSLQKRGSLRVLF